MQTDENFGLTDNRATGQIILQLNYINRHGDVCPHVPYWPYHCEGSRQEALDAAKQERARLLSLPQFQVSTASPQIGQPERAATG